MPRWVPVCAKHCGSARDAIQCACLFLDRERLFLDTFQQNGNRLPILWQDTGENAPTIGGELPEQLQMSSPLPNGWQQAWERACVRFATFGRRSYDLDRTRYSLLRTCKNASISLSPPFGRMTRTILSDYQRLIRIGEVLFTLLTLSSVLTLLWGIWIVRQIGIFANRLQTRQEQQQRYTHVISALNGPLQLSQLVEQVLPACARKRRCSGGRAVYCRESSP